MKKLAARCARFSLRSLLILTVVSASLAGWIGLHARQWHDEQDALAAINKQIEEPETEFKVYY